MSDHTDEQTDNFTAAFEKLAELGDKPVPADLLSSTPEAVTDPAPETETEQSETPDTSETPEAPAAPEPPGAAPTTDGALTDQDILARMAALVRQTSPAAPEPEPTASSRAPEPAEQPIYTPEEQQVLTKYIEEWPEVAQAEALMRRQEYRHLVQHVFNEVLKTIQPLQETVTTLATHTQYSQLAQQVPDYDDIRDRVVEWVGQQPAYLQPAYNHVIQRGTPDEVVDLINRYRQSSGTSAPAAAVSAPPVVKKTEPALPADAKQAAASLAPVSSKRSAVAPSADPQDFDSAFAAFASKL